MNIALIANDKKKELMIQFCLAYSGILAKHDLCATSITGKMISDATGIPVARYLPGERGGVQQIGARIACNEIDLLIYFRDPMTNHSNDEMNNTVIRLCNVHNIPLATNIATAEPLILALDRGDLDWRNYVGKSGF